MDNDNAFKQRVVDSLARLETHMENLVGNGQPGRVTKIEDDVESLQKARWYLAGAVVGISTAASAVIHFVFGK
jgi:hypothetical protein